MAAQNKMKYLITLVVIVAIVVIGGELDFNKPQIAQGSVSRGGEYQGTTTSTGRFAPLTVLDEGPGTLGSVIITGAATGVINIFDATTTNINHRVGSSSTSSILVASFPASTATGTYTFDRNLFSGLFVEIVGTMPTTTITYRP